jgi:hypothetical protein
MRPTVSVLLLVSLIGVAACSKSAGPSNAASDHTAVAGGDIAATVPAGGFNFDPDPCKAVLDAKYAQARAPAYAVTYTRAQPGRPTQSGESRRLNGVSYYLVNGAWVSKAQTADELVEELKHVSKDAKMVCKSAGNEAVGGQPSTIYDAKIDNMDTISESRMWISKTTGLPLKSHTQIEDGQVLDQTYVYAGVTAPSGAKG